MWIACYFTVYMMLNTSFQIFRKLSHRICSNFTIIEAIIAGTNSLKRFLKLLVQRNTKIKIKNVMASLRCHDDYDYNKTQIMRNFHPYIIQLWKPFFHIFFHGDVIIAQAWEVSAQKTQSSHFNLPNVGEIF